MTTAIPMDGLLDGLSGLISPTRSTAESPQGKQIRQMQEDIRRHFLDSYAIRRVADEALTELDGVEREASIAGWNGYGAVPLDPEACAFARLFLTALPTTAPVPEVSADGDGEVSVDWIFGNKRALTVSIGRGGRCTYAWIRGQSNARGTDWIANEIPASIASALGQLTSDKTA
jgi:hypothetical protein